MSNFILTDRKTHYLLPPSLEDWLTQDHLARFVVEVIDGLDPSSLTRQHAGRGSKAHQPATLLAILVYGYSTGVFSSRKLEMATEMELLKLGTVCLDGAKIFTPTLRATARSRMCTSSNSKSGSNKKSRSYWHWQKMLIRPTPLTA